MAQVDNLELEDVLVLDAAIVHEEHDDLGRHVGDVGNLLRDGAHRVAVELLQLVRPILHVLRDELLLAGSLHI